MFSSKRTEGSTKDYFLEMPDGYRETISEGTKAINFLDKKLTRGSGTREENLSRLRDAIDDADAIVVGAGAGLSTSAGFTYSGERFMRYFKDFYDRYGITDMYSGGFYPYPEPEIQWAWWSRHIYFNRYIDAPSDVYPNLLSLVKDKDYFVLTTNVDHQFQRAGFDKKRLFYTQGDYGLLQSVRPKAQNTFDNEETVMKMMEDQGFVKNANGIFSLPSGNGIKMQVSADLIPVCPADGRKMHVLYLELGVGMNTPVIIKFPFWKAVERNRKSFYVCINYGDAGCDKSIEKRSICMDADIAEALRDIINYD